MIKCPYFRLTLYKKNRRNKVPPSKRPVFLYSIVKTTHKTTIIHTEQKQDLCQTINRLEMTFAKEKMKWSYDKNLRSTPTSKATN